MLLDLGAHLKARACPAGITNEAWPRAPSSASTWATITWTFAIPPLVAHAFCPFSTHSSFASSYLARVRSEDTSDPASGSETQNAADLRLGLGAEALGHPFAPLLRSAVRLDRRDRERRSHDRHADSGVAPEQLLVDEREHDPALVEPELSDPLQAVETDLGRLLDDRPRGLLALVPLRGRPGGPSARQSREPSPGCPSGPGSARARTAAAPPCRYCCRRRSAPASWLPCRCGSWSCLSGSIVRGRAEHRPGNRGNGSIVGASGDGIVPFSRSGTATMSDLQARDRGSNHFRRLGIGADPAGPASPASRVTP